MKERLIYKMFNTLFIAEFLTDSDEVIVREINIKIGTQKFIIYKNVDLEQALYLYLKEKGINYEIQ